MVIFSVKIKSEDTDGYDTYTIVFVDSIYKIKTQLDIHDNGSMSVLYSLQDGTREDMIVGCGEGIACANAVAHTIVDYILKGENFISIPDILMMVREEVDMLEEIESEVCADSAGVVIDGEF